MCLKYSLANYSFAYWTNHLWMFLKPFMDNGSHKNMDINKNIIICGIYCWSCCYNSITQVCPLVCLFGFFQFKNLQTVREACVATKPPSNGNKTLSQPLQQFSLIILITLQHLQLERKRAASIGSIWQAVCHPNDGNSKSSYTHGHAWIHPPQHHT